MIIPIIARIEIIIIVVVIALVVILILYIRKSRTSIHSSDLNDNSDYSVGL